MSLNDLENLNILDEDSEEDEDVYIPVPFRFHDLAQRDEFALLDEEIKKNNKRDYNPHEVVLSLDQEDNYGFTPLHIAIMRGNIDTIRVCIENGVKLTCQTEGIPYSIFLLLVASSTNVFQDNLYEVLKMFILPDHMETMKDRLGRTVAHVAAEHNQVEIVEKLLADYPSLVEMVDNEGNSILHAACKSNSVDVISFLMDDYSDMASIVNKKNQNILHYCLEWNALDSYQALIRLHNPALDIHAEDCFGRTPIDQWKRIMEIKRESGSSEFPHETKKTLIIVPEPYDDHKTCVNPPKRTEKVLPPEQIQRLNVLVNPSYGGCLLDHALNEKVEFMQEKEMAELAHILRVHDVNYVMKIMNACAQANTTGFKNVDIDTIVSEKSMEQARRAVKSVCDAVDELHKTATTQDGYRNVFCCVRPPGHHIGTNGAVNNPNNANVSQGFCLFNNVAIAAAYARSQYPEFQRIAILDFDIHHGNGTEDCIQHLCPCVKTTVNVVDNMEVRYQNYQYKPWLNDEDSKNVFFASLHGYGKLAPTSTDYFYPGSGHSTNKVDYIPQTVTRTAFTKPVIVDIPMGKQKDFAAFYWRENLRLNVFPRLLEFKPDLIFLSSGFDGHMNDSLNNGFGGLTENDFAYVTQEIMKIANHVCEGRVISILEGGYNILGGCASPLALSVHEQVQVLTGHFYDECDPEEWAKSSEMEREMMEKQAQEKGVSVERVNVMNEEKQEVIVNEDEKEEEEEFDFDDMSEEEADMNENHWKMEEEKEEPVKEVKMEKPVQAPKVPKAPQVTQPPVDIPADIPMEEEEDEDGSEDLVNYDMPEIEEGELDKIVDPLANENCEVENGRRKRTRAKVDYVALEAQLKKEEEEMRKKQMKMQEYLCLLYHSSKTVSSSSSSTISFFLPLLVGGALVTVFSFFSGTAPIVSSSHLFTISSVYSIPSIYS